ncbi:MAG: multiheme c-type cytochrome, partial [Planctomycetota bacterium]
MLSSRQPGPLARVALALSFLCGALLVASAAIQTTPQDFQQPGTQPNGLNTPLEPSGNCAFCHGNYDPEIAPLNTWAGTMMANSTRDPIFHAALAIAEQDAVASGALCLRCHSPNGFLEGNATPTDGSGLSGKDFEGVACNFCHRMVDPVLAPENPAPDAAVLANLAEVPGTSHNGQYVVDPDDNRRGPFDPEVCNVLHPETYESPYHQEALLCGTCHEVSNPAFIRQGGPVPSASDVYVAAVDGQPHPTHSQYDEFPIERTYSEWLNSDFAQGPVEMGGLFGGNKTAVSSCQDCHMPDASGTGCTPIFNPPFRDDMPVHSFLGANSWVPRSIYDLDQTQLLYGPAEISGVPLEIFEATIARNLEFMGNAATVELSGAEGALDVRVINNTGHKLPTGYNEGCRMWLNVRFFDASGALVDERGFYDTATADLSTSDTKVYEMELGLDDAMSVATGLPAEKSFHFVLNNKIFKDNRIPPRGFTNAAFEAVQAQPV